MSSQTSRSLASKARPPLGQLLTTHARGALVLVVLLTFSPKAALGGTGGGRPVITGQLPDIEFTAGVTATKHVAYTYFIDPMIDGQAIAIYGGPAQSGLSVRQSYGTGADAAFPYVTPVGPAGGMNEYKSWSFDVTSFSTTPSGFYSIELYSYRSEFGTDNLISRRSTAFQRMMWIGTINVYVGFSATAATFTETATSSNTSGASLLLNSPLLDGRPQAHLFVTHNRNPGASRSGIDNNHAVRVQYDRSSSKWSITNVDGTHMQTGVAFNVRVESAAASTHVSSAANSAGNSTCIDNQVLNGNAHALAFVSVGGGTALAAPIGVYYSGSQWCIFRQDLGAMPIGVEFHVKAFGRPGSATSLDPLFVSEVFTQQGGSSGTSTVMNRPSTNVLAPVLVVTPNLNPPGSSLAYNPHVTGVIGLWIYPRWAVYNEDGAVMPASAAFNIWKPIPPL